jgi:hypothetical protein
VVSCYDCGLPVSDAELVRRYITERVSGLSPFGTAYRSCRKRVNLCQACARARTGARLSCLALVAIALAPVVCIGFLTHWANTRATANRTPATAPRTPATAPAGR